MSYYLKNLALFFLMALVCLGCRHGSSDDSAAKEGTTASCEKAWVFFDLGETLVDTETFNFEKIFYMPGALAYFSDLKSKGYPLGLIINIPESLGTTQAEKLAKLMEYVAQSWIEPAPFAWEDFQPNILLPPNDSQRKPAPFLFEQAAGLARDAGCKVVYQGENQEEMAVARAAGMVDFRVGEGESFYLPEEKIRELSQ